MTRSLLFSPFDLRAMRLRNRLVVSPMCQYSAVDGRPLDWHRIHYGKLAVGGAGLVIVEATAVEARGRISHGDLGLWSDDQVEAHARIVELVRAGGAQPAIQLAHAGRKGSVLRPWEGGAPITGENARPGEPPWRCVAPSAIPVAESWPRPDRLSGGEIAEICRAFAAATRRAHKAGYELIEIHGAHGYLIHQFLSPLMNHRDDGYGGDRDRRMRFALEVVSAVRSEWPERKPLCFRVSAIDGDAGGWGLDDTVALARRLKEIGVDIVDCSSGGAVSSPVLDSLRRRPGFQVPFAGRVRRDAGLATMAVGLIVEPQAAEQVLHDGQADLVALGREWLDDPQWGLHAAIALEGDEAGYRHWPEQYAWSLSGRAEWMRRHRAGELA